jgi:hypothetical protein
MTTTHQTVAQHCDEAVRAGLGPALCFCLAAFTFGPNVQRSLLIAVLFGGSTSRQQSNYSCDSSRPSTTGGNFLRRERPE